MKQAIFRDFDFKKNFLNSNLTQPHSHTSGTRLNQSRGNYVRQVRWPLTQVTYPRDFRPELLNLEVHEITMRTRASASLTLLPLLPYHFEVSAPLGLSFIPLPSFLFDLFYREQRSDKITRAESRKKRELKNREVNLKGLQKINDRLGELLEDQNLFLEHPNVRKGIKGKDSRKEELVRT